MQVELLHFSSTGVIGEVSIVLRRDRHSMSVLQNFYIFCFVKFHQRKPYLDWP